MKWYVGSDHAGYALKAALSKVLIALGDTVEDLGAGDGTTSVDYPDFGERVARSVVANPGTLGLLVCGTGIGISMAANKVPGCRAARVTDGYSARMAREHNDAQVICLGERVTGPGLAEELVRIFRDAKFAEGRHAARVAKIDAIR